MEEYGNDDEFISSGEEDIRVNVSDYCANGSTINNDDNYPSDESIPEPHFSPTPIGVDEYTVSHDTFA